jgi:hypothetical protein
LDLHFSTNSCFCCGETFLGGTGNGKSDVAS